jgi:hypothetical protein
MKKLNNKGNAGNTVLALGLFLFAIFGTLVVVDKYVMDVPFLDISGGSAGGGGEDAGGVDGCDDEVTPDVDINCQDEYSGAANTEATNLRRIKGSGATGTAWTCGTEQTDLIYGKEYEFISGTDTTDFTGNGVGKYFTYTPKCQADDEMNVKVNADEDASGLTSTWYNTNHGTTYQAIGSGGSKVTYIEYQAAANEVYGNKFIGQGFFVDHGAHSAKYSNILQLPLHALNYTKPNSVKIYNGPEAGTVLDAIPCPLTAVNAAGYINYCFEAPVVDETAVQIAIDLQAITGVTPSVDVSAHFWSCGVFENSETHVWDWGCENEDNAAVSIAEASVEATTIDVTA